MPLLSTENYFQKMQGCKVIKDGKVVKDEYSHSAQYRELYLQAESMQDIARSMLKTRDRQRIEDYLSKYKGRHGCDKVLRLALNIVMKKDK